MTEQRTDIDYFTMTQARNSEIDEKVSEILTSLYDDSAFWNLTHDTFTPPAPFVGEVRDSIMRCLFRMEVEHAATALDAETVFKNCL